MFVFFDANQNGVFDGKDTAISNMVVTLKDAQNITRGVAPTDRDGYVIFENMDPGDYTLWALTQPLGYFPTTGYPVAVHLERGVQVDALLGFASTQSYLYLPVYLRSPQP